VNRVQDAIAAKSNINKSKKLSTATFVQKPIVTNVALRPGPIPKV